MESAIVYGLTATLYGENHIRNGAVVEDNFDQYLLLRMDEMPEIRTHLALSGGEKWGVLANPGVPPVAPAVANAIFRCDRQADPQPPDPQPRPDGLNRQTQIAGGRTCRPPVATKLRSRPPGPASRDCSSRNAGRGAVWQAGTLVRTSGGHLLRLPLTRQRMSGKRTLSPDTAGSLPLPVLRPGRAHPCLERRIPGG